MSTPAQVVSTSSQPTIVATSPTSTPTPLGISATQDSVRQSAPSKEETPRTKKPGFIKTFILSIKKLIGTIFDKIKGSIEKVFFCIFPFKKYQNIFFRKQEVISPTEQKYLDYQRLLYRVDSLSSTLVYVEAEELLKEFNAFEKLGKLEKQQKNSRPRFETGEVTTTEEIIKIGRDIAEKNHKKLITVLKEYYQSQILKLEIELKKEHNPK